MSSFRLTLLAAGVAILGALTFSTAHAEESWIGMATGANSTSAYYGISRWTSREGAEAGALQGCSKHGYCPYAQSWNQGCIYVSLGNRRSDGAAVWGSGPTLESARQNCESTGSDCNIGKDAGYCVLPTTNEGGNNAPLTTAPPPMSQVPDTTAPTTIEPSSPPDVSQNTPAYRPNEDEAPGDIGAAAPHVTIWQEDTAIFTKAQDNNSFTLCPTHAKGHCYTFFNGDRPGRLVTEQALSNAESHIKGSREGGAEDYGYEFSTLLNSIRNGLVRYHFVDLAKTADHHYEGLICIGYSGIKNPNPIWQECGYVAEVRRYRTGE